MPRSADAASTTAGRRRPSWSLLLVALLLLVSGVFLWLQHDTRRVEAVGDDTPAAAALPTTRTDITTPKPVFVRRVPADPERLRIPALDVDAPVAPVKAVRRTLVPPRDPDRLGWWADGARPGSARGSALVTGHTVHTGGGALEDLEQLRRGDRVTVGAGDDRISYRVRTVEILGKGALAERAGRLFAQDVPGRLVLITCERWNGVEYLSNVVVTAVPSSSS